MPQTFILPILTPDIGITLLFIHEVVVRAGQLPLTGMPEVAEGKGCDLLSKGHIF